MITPANFTLLAKGTDVTTQLPLAYVAHEHIDHKRRITVYKLLKRNGHWYNMGQWISLGRFRVSPEKNGRKLSDSQLCQTLIRHAEMMTV